MLSLFFLAPFWGAAQTAPAPAGDAGQARAAEERFYPQFYLGLWAGGLLNTSIPQASKGWEGGSSRGLAGGGALAAELRIARFLSFQAEAVAIYDVFSAAKTDGIPGIAGATGKRWTNHFTSWSLIFPLLVKIPLEIDDFTLSPFFGAYYTIPLGGSFLDADPDKNAENIPVAYKTDPPFGLSVGFDVGLAMGPGEFFAGLRFDQDFGLTSVKQPEGLQYSRNRIGVSFGYKFRLAGNRKPASRAKQAAPAPIRILRSVYFPADGSVPTPAQLVNLSVVGELLRASPDLKVTLRGYAAPYGTPQSCLTISEARAQFCRTRLIQEYGLESSRITTEAYGGTERRPENWDGTDRQLRSVEIFMTNE
jgi:outer membrane protein OmpA-like peptidoglycan-associated protein